MFSKQVEEMLFAAAAVFSQFVQVAHLEFGRGNFGDQFTEAQLAGAGRIVRFKIGSVLVAILGNPLECMRPPEEEVSCLMSSGVQTHQIG